MWNIITTAERQRSAVGSLSISPLNIYELEYDFSKIEAPSSSQGGSKGYPAIG